MSQHFGPQGPVDPFEQPTEPAEPARPPGSNEISFGPAPKGRGSRRGLLIGGAATAVLLVGGGAFAYQARLAPHGAQPDSVIPASALAYVRFDADPTAGQKIAATRFLGKLPHVAKQGAALDVKHTLWTWVVDAEPKLKTLDYANDVEPWLGDRAGLALLPGGTTDKPHVVVAIAVNDQAKAKAGIDKISAAAGGGSDLDVTTKDDFALLTPKGDGAAVLADLAKGSLATNSTYTSDMSALGDTGIASAWIDTQRVGDLAKSLGTGSTAFDTSQLAAAGRVSMALRFDADYVELAGSTRGGPVTKKDTGGAKDGGAASLPADTMAAVQVNGLGDVVGTMWPQLTKALPAGTISQVENEFGVTLPGDLQLLLGQSLTLALPKQDLASLSGSDLPTVGVKDVTTDGAKVDGLVTKLGELVGMGNVVKHGVDGNTVYLATSDDYLATLRAAGGLGGTDLFKKAVVGGDTATAVAFVNLDALEPTYIDKVPADYRDLVASLAGVGLSVTSPGDGTGTFSMRLVGN